MRAPKNPPKNPGMGAVDGAVREAAERQMYEQSVRGDTQPAETVQDVAPEAERQVAQAPAEQPVGLFATLQKVPWWVWPSLFVGGWVVSQLLDDDEDDESEVAAKNSEDKELEESDGDGEDDGELEEDESDDEEDSVIPASLRRANRKPFRKRSQTSPKRKTPRKRVTIPIRKKSNDVSDPDEVAEDHEEDEEPENEENE